MAIHDVVTAARSPWQNAYVERLIGSIRRECLDHVIVWNERGLHRVWFARIRSQATVIGFPSMAHQDKSCWPRSSLCFDPSR
jgi:integrase-like protein